MSEITAVPEALKLLNTLVERGEELEMGTSPGPWYWQNGSLQSSGTYNVLSKPTHFLHDRPMLAEARSLVPAMVKGARARLKQRELALADIQELKRIYPGPPNSEGIKASGKLEGVEESAIEDANAYRPALVELGWWPK